MNKISGKESMHERNFLTEFNYDFIDELEYELSNFQKVKQPITPTHHFIYSLYH